MIGRRAIIALMLASLLLAGCGGEAKPGDIVTVHFTGKLADGKAFESTVGGEPRQVHIGANLILPAFEQALVGMKAGENKTVLVTAAQAFGRRDESAAMIQVLQKSDLPHAIDYRLGKRLKASIRYPDGSKGEREVTVAAVDDQSVTVDANHPLAGKDLTFEIELVGFR